MISRIAERGIERALADAGASVAADFSFNMASALH
jgi:hypothetical protein